MPNSYNLKNYPILVTVGTISKRKGQFNVLKTLPDIIKEFSSHPLSLHRKQRTKKTVNFYCKKLKLNR